jgi:hypothetical protein
MPGTRLPEQEIFCTGRMGSTRCVEAVCHIQKSASTVDGVKPDARGSQMHFEAELNRSAAFDFNLMAAQGFSDRILAAINALEASFNLAETLPPELVTSTRKAAGFCDLMILS